MPQTVSSLPRILFGVIRGCPVCRRSDGAGAPRRHAVLPRPWSAQARFARRRRTRARPPPRHVFEATVLSASSAAAVRDATKSRAMRDALPRAGVASSWLQTRALHPREDRPGRRRGGASEEGVGAFYYARRNSYPKSASLLLLCPHDVLELPQVVLNSYLGAHLQRISARA